jgi:MFS family permease
MNFIYIFRALKYRNYRLFFIGQGISLVGTWMQQVALSWLVYRLTGSALMLGVINFASQIPTFFLTPFAGVLADRYNRHHMLVLTQSLSMIQALILSVLVLTNTITIWQVVALGIFIGFVNACDIPVRQSFTVEMIENEEDLGNAIALNSSLFNLARLIGPSIGGILIGLFGEGVCFLLNGISFLAVILSLLAMNIDSQPRARNNNHIFIELKEGFQYAFGFAPIKYILMLLGLISFMGVPYQVLMPVFAKDIFHGGPHTLGFLLAMVGLGALMGAMFLAARKTTMGLGRVIVMAAVVFGVGLICFSLSRVLWLSFVFTFVCGFGIMVHMASSNTILQTIVEDDKRGRIMSFYAMSFMGTAPFGSLLAGTLASKIGAPNAVLIGGICCLLGAIIFSRQLPLLREKVHPIFVKKGVIPEVAKGIQSNIF